MWRERDQVLPWKIHPRHDNRLIHHGDSVTFGLATAYCPPTENDPHPNLPNGWPVCLTVGLICWPKQQLEGNPVKLTKTTSATITSIIRLVCLLRIDLNSEDITWNFVPYMIWTVVELNVSTITGKSPYGIWMINDHTNGRSKSLFALSSSNLHVPPRPTGAPRHIH